MSNKWEDVLPKEEILDAIEKAVESGSWADWTAALREIRKAGGIRAVVES